MNNNLIHYRDIAFHTLGKHHTSCAIAAELPNSKTISLWHATLRNMGCDVDSKEPTPKELFDFVKAEFERQKGVTLDIIFSQSYIASEDGLMPIPSDEASRIYSGKSEVYIDNLVLSALFEYIAAFYIWAKDYDDKDVYAFCFKYVVTLLNYSWRLGIISDDEHEVELVKKIVDHCDICAINLIADLYWSCLAFAFCHEIAHIYLKHSAQENGSNSDQWAKEYEADALGYEVYLNIIETVKEDSGVPFSGIFHDYLYVAPMILFQFYEDAYFLSYWLFGELAGSSHPPLNKRAEALLRISERQEYTFETREGNILLNNYLDVSDWLREQLIIKLQKGKLNNLIQKGFAFMNKSGYREAVQFQENMCEALRNTAQEYGVNYDRLIGLWNTAVDIELLDAPSEYGFVWSYKDKTYSSKLFNVKFSLKKVLMSILEYGGTFEFPSSPEKTVFVVLSLLCKIADISTVKLSEVDASVLSQCYKLHAHEHPVNEDVLLQVDGATQETITHLQTLGCIEEVEGMVYLKESILIR